MKTVFKNLRPIAVLAAWVALSALNLTAQRTTDEAFSEGNAALAAEDIPRAIAAYNEALMAGSSANLHYNLGTAYAQNEDWGWASIHFLKALALHPNHADARAHLALVRKRAGLEWSNRTALERFAATFSLSGWAWLATGAFWGTVLLWFLNPPGGSLFNSLLRTASIAVLVISVFALGLYHFERGRGIVLKPSELRVAATESSPTSVELEPGIEATVLNEMNGFYLIQTENGEEGYLSRAEFATVWDN
jgi:tetratricopeptide (TPR) repeat protein|tara:strand:+ start:1534 stop:2280 length:747 start_codon:yes stop_codon:yes gene_type:complete